MQHHQMVVSDPQAIIRRARKVIHILIHSTVKRIELEYDDRNTPECNAACGALWDELKAEVEDWAFMKPRP